MDKNLTDIQWWHRIKLPDGTYTPGQVVHGPDGGNWPTTRFGMPEDLTGLHVLDVGAWDGFFSFEAEKRGAKLVRATDCPFDQGGTWAGSDGFKYAKKALNSKVRWDALNIESKSDINQFGGFHLVLCYGVLYHLKSPLIAVEHLVELTAPGGTILVETAICNQDIAVLEYRPGFHNDPTNYFYPSVKWIETAFKQSGAKSVKVVYNNTSRATFEISV